MQQCPNHEFKVMQSRNIKATDLSSDPNAGGQHLLILEFEQGQGWTGPVHWLNNWRLLLIHWLHGWIDSSVEVHP